MPNKIDNSIVKVVNITESDIKAKALEVPKFKVIAYLDDSAQSKALEDNLIDEIQPYSVHQQEDDQEYEDENDQLDQEEEQTI